MMTTFHDVEFVEMEDGRVFVTYNGQAIEVAPTETLADVVERLRALQK